MTDDERLRLLQTRYDVDLYPASAPRPRPMKSRNRSHKERIAYHRPTERIALNNKGQRVTQRVWRFE